MAHHAYPAGTGTSSPPLAGVRVVSMATNVPGPVAVARLVSLGASALKIEPPGGDYLAFAARGWYDALHAGVNVRSLDLKHATDRATLFEALAQADVFVTSHRPSALARLGLDAETVAARCPRLCLVRILGAGGPEAESAGHDLTYQARAGLLQPPALPATLHVDLSTAEAVATMACALLVQRAHTGRGAWADVGMSEVAERHAEPRTHGLTTPRGVLGGALPQYGLYRASDGWIAVAALEPAFLQRLAAGLALEDVTEAALTAAIACRDVSTWLRWAREHDVPMAAVAETDGVR
ncbi:MAG: CoA transferase [Gemmatimonadetes bacterium]|nr:CoA transferase [Gemmatimonadota bacterium]